MEEQVLSSAIEAMLFASDRPITLSRIREVLLHDEEGPSEEEIAQRIEVLKLKFMDASCGFELREAQGGYQFTTKRENAAVIQKFLATKPFRLGRSALEVLAIIAYRQPLTRAEIDVVRGIDSSHLLRVLMERGLVRMGGKAEIPGRPVQYGTTPKFLETIGMKALGELPPLSELDQLQGDTDDPVKAMEAGLERFISDTKPAEEMQAQITDGIAEIDTMLASVVKGDGEVYASKAHAETALANKEALEAFQDTTPRRRKQQAVVKFDDLQMEPLAPLVEAESNDDPGPTSVN